MDHRLGAALDRVGHPARINPTVAAGGIAAWLAVAAISGLMPNSPKLAPRDTLAISAATPFSVVGGLAVGAAWLGLWALVRTPGRVGSWAARRVTKGSAWLLAAALWLMVWVFTTAKTALLPPPYFDAPQSILESLWKDRGILTESLGNSLALLLAGFAAGLVAGLVTGVAIGWYQAANYWVHPILIFIGPVPALAWVPIAFVLLPTAYTGAVFMIALSVWFPITVLTRAGILAVPRSYYDVAQTLGARGWFLVLRVSVPASLPSIFTGAFMALGSSFVSLTVAENFGVNSGLGWYLNWKKSWGDFPGVYAGIVVLVLVCGIALTVLFRARNHVLRWENGLTRW